MSGAHPQPTDETHADATTWFDLRAFQRDLLLVALQVERDGEVAIGLELSCRLEDRYGNSINHGQLYTNLDELRDRGFIKKRRVDGRSNEYVPTEEAARALQAYRTEIAAAIRGSE